MTRNVIIKRALRKTVSISITDELEILIKAPLKMPEDEIEGLLIKYGKWIKKHIGIKKEQNIMREKNLLSKADIEMLKAKAEKTVINRVNYFKEIAGVTPSNVKITSAKTRWGSCSFKNSLCFTFRIALLPLELIDYIVLHELVHIKIKNHSKKFYLEIEKYMPDYKARIQNIKKIQKEI